MSEARETNKSKARVEMEEVLARGDVQEMAEFFDRTDTSELDLDEVDEVVIERPELEQISIRLPKEDLDALRRRAAKSGVGYTTLIRMIVRAHLDNPLTY
ncbi:MAG: ribbon-helix-helix protein, CopG family [Rubrobacter sp.]|nr:ribbon-helix-helix protein, CopG family [Rubrobacter sp.]MDQ3363785.1 BrnA antitoxin family protein [Actinomycetota bacterium]MDQ3377502.1 BrnA antitoxin family protein [Actinomycetota bacterium]